MSTEETPHNDSKKSRKSKADHTNFRYVSPEDALITTSKNHTILDHDKYKYVTIKRKKVRKITGNRLYFKCIVDDQILYSAKAKSNVCDKIVISQGNEVHLSDTYFDSLITTEDNNSKFSLFSNEKGKTLFSLSFELPHAEINGDRKMRLFIFYPEDVPSPLVSSSVADTPDFGGMYRIFSIKNAILTNEQESTQYISIRKTAKDTLVVDSIIDLEPIYLFSIGICAFMGRKPK